MCKPSFHIPSLDGMRAVAIGIVFLSHIGLGQIIPGGFGVTIFFFLSGYLITTLLRRELMKSGRINFKQFYIRRMLRIWPAFYVTLTAGALLTLIGFLPGEVRIAPFLGQVLHAANYYSIFYGDAGAVVGTEVYWSLAVEEHYYLVFPLLYLALSRLGLKQRGQAISFALLCVIVLVWRYILVVHMGQGEQRTFHATDTRVDSIMFGCILAVWLNPVMDPLNGSERIWKFVLFPAGLALIAGSLLYRTPAFRETARYTLQSLALFPIFVAAIRYPEWWPIRILNTRLMRFLGLISYPFYLVHFTVIRALVKSQLSLTPVMLGVLSLLISLALAYGIYRLIDQPLARFRKKHQVV